MSAPIPSAASQAAETISAAELTAHLAVLTQDSMRGRDTPSPGLERTARYVADQLKQLGLLPAATTWMHDDLGVTWIHRYPLPGKLPLDYARSAVMFSSARFERGKPVTTQAGDTMQAKAAAGFLTALHFLGEIVPMEDEHRRPAVLVAGRHTPATIRQAQIKTQVLGATVLYLAPAGMDSASWQPVLDQLRAWSHSLIVLSTEDSATFATRLQAAAHLRPLLVAELYTSLRMQDGIGSWAAEVRPEAIQNVLSAAGIELKSLRADPTPVVRTLPFMQVWLETKIDSTKTDTVTAPNVVALLQGSDSTIDRRRPLVISAHMDGPSQADDNAAGVAGLLALAKAFRQPEARLRRPLIFLATSGGAKKDLWGSNYFILTRRGWGGITVGLNVNLDRISGRAGDSVVIDGVHDLDFPVSPTWIAAAHPELGLAITEPDRAVCPRSDHVAFRQVALPSVSFCLGQSEAAPRGPKTPAPVNAEQTARLLRLVFYVVRAIDSAEYLPRWTSAGRARILQSWGP